MNKIMSLVASLLIAALASIEPIDEEGKNKANKITPGFSFISFSEESSSETSEPSSSLEEEQDDFFNCTRYGPFHMHSPDFDATFKYALYSIGSQRIVEKIRVLDSSRNVVAAISKPSKDYTKGEMVSATFTVPIHDYLTSSGLTLYFEIVQNSTREVLKRYGATIYPVDNHSVSYSELKSQVYTSKSFGFMGTGETMVNTREDFDFRPMGDYLNVDHYYELDFSKNYFYYPNPYILPYQSVNLRFNDSINQFRYLTHQNNGDVVLPLSLYMNGSKVTFTFKNKYYVNKKTLQISDSYRQNYVLTNRFYLPINGRKLFNNKMLYIEITGLGQSELSTTIPLRYSVDKSYVGVATDGENYVVGGN